MSPGHPASREFQGTERFRILGRIGAGGMGTVYRARDVERDMTVALKTIDPTAGSTALMRFKREFRALADVRHPNLITLGELGEQKGTLFYTMELVDGVDLRTWLRGADAPVRPASERTGATLREHPLSTDASADTFVDPVPGMDVTPDGPTVETMVRESSGPRTTSADPDPRLVRMRRALCQLISALRAVHDAGLVHRDVKPANVLVRPDGRVVLLDFGVVRDADERAPQGMTGDHNVVGTAEYMAPEQAAGDPVGPAADAYAVGVILYEALAGRRPFDGTFLRVLWAKQHEDPVPPSSLRAGVPADLDALCMALLRRDPATRPAEDEILRALGDEESRDAYSSPRVVRPGASDARGFVGRKREVAALRAAADAVRATQGPRVLVVTGESGLGKTALVRAFVDEHAAGADELVLWGRCSERESVPFKGIDGVVDALAAWLTRTDPVVAATVIPRRVQELARAFPVLGRVHVVERAPRFTSVDDAQERRARVFSSARELFTRLSDARRLVIAIDDLQWADADSLAILAEILRRPDAPAILVLATARAPSEVERLSRALSPSDDRAVPVEHLPIERLKDADAQELARVALAEADASAIDLVVRESGGHPLFLHELATLRAQRGDGVVPASLDEIWRNRASSLSAETKRVLELVVVSPVTLDDELLAATLGATREDIARRLSELEVARLARVSRLGGKNATVDVWHARVRAALRAWVGQEASRAALGDVARTLEKRGGDDEALYSLWHDVGDVESARRYARRAAERAMEGLAFDRAAKLFHAALEDTSGAERRALLVRLGDAHASLGRGRVAAEAYLEAAGEETSGDAVELRRRAAEQLLRAGHFDDGRRVLARVLDAFGFAMPHGTPATVLSLVAAEAKNRLRGLSFTARAPEEIDDNVRRRIDVTWTAAMGLAGKDNLGSANFQARHLALALAAGDTYRISRALSLQAGFSALGGDEGYARAQAQLSRAHRLAVDSGHPHALALNRWMTGFCDFMGGRFAQSVEHCDAAERMVRETCPDATWERSNCHVYAASSLAMMGSLDEVARRVPGYASEAEARGDLYEIANLPLGVLALVPAARMDVVAGRRAIDDALRRWGAEETNEGVLGGIGRAILHLVDGDGGAALTAVDAAWARAGMFKRVAWVRASVFEARARARVVEAARARGSARTSHLRAAALDVKAVSDVPLPWTRPVAASLHGLISAVEGKEGDAVDQLRAAASSLDAVGLRLHAAIARRAAGGVVGGVEGQQLENDASQFLRARGVKDVEAFALVFGAARASR